MSMICVDWGAGHCESQTHAAPRLYEANPLGGINLWSHKAPQDQGRIFCQRVKLPPGWQGSLLTVLSVA